MCKQSGVVISQGMFWKQHENSDQTRRCTERTSKERMSWRILKCQLTLNIVNHSRLPPLPFFSFSWVIDGLGSMEGIGPCASSFLTDLCQFTLACTAVCWLPLIVMVLLGLVVWHPSQDLWACPRKALKSLSCSSYLLPRYAEFCAPNLRSIYRDILGWEFPEMRRFF